MKIGRITISDRASAGVYEDLSGPAIEQALQSALGNGANYISQVVPDETDRISAALRRFSDHEHCALIVTTGGTGIGPRDVTPEATAAVLEKQLPGFAEWMRASSMTAAPTAILSRAIAGVRGVSLIINLPGKPAAVRQCLEALAPAIREALAHLSGQDPHVKA